MQACASHLRRPIGLLVIATVLLGGLDLRADEPLQFGTLQCDAARATVHARVGINLALAELAWDRLEPRHGEWDLDYLADARRRIKAHRDAGQSVVLDLGMQYPPSWIRQLQHSRFINQYGQAYNEDAKPGANGVNAVFNQAIRDHQQAYAARVLHDLGQDVVAVRLGWGYYGELCFPAPRYRGQVNAFWAYDDLAQGKAQGLPPGIGPCPVPGWIPGNASENHEDARRFVEWYLEALRDYHDWQIATVRRHFGGRLLMMYPSWGLRPGVVEELIRHDLVTDTQGVQRGLDFDRLVVGITDRQVVVHCTWLDSDPAFGDDAGDDPARWGPARYLSHLAHRHPLQLSLWGENTGDGDLQAMRLTFSRMKDYGYTGLLWAFEPQLYDGRHAAIDDYARLIAEALSAPPRRQ